MDVIIEVGFNLIIEIEYIEYFRLSNERVMNRDRRSDVWGFQVLKNFHPSPAIGGGDCGISEIPRQR